MRKGTREVFEAWEKGRAWSIPTRALMTDGKSIFSYNTAILAEVPGEVARTEDPDASDGEVVVLNRTTYSNTTTNHQNGIAVLLGYTGLEVLEVGSQGYGVKPDQLVDVAFAK